MPLRVLFLIAAGIAASGVAARAEGAATRPDRPARGDRAKDPLPAAIRELTREAQLALKNNQPMPRGDSSYFAAAAEKPAVEAVLRQLNRQLAQHSLVDAYVKFQLLSAIEGPLEEDQAELAARALVNAGPQLMPMPGVNAQQQRQLDQMVLGIRSEADLGELKARLTDEVTRVTQANDPILRYREALLARIPVTDATRPLLLKVRLEDLRQRLEAGLEVRGGETLIIGDFKTFAATSGNPRAINELATVVEEFARRPRGTAYVSVEWTNNRAVWQKRPAGLCDRRMGELAGDLRQLARRNR